MNRESSLRLDVLRFPLIVGVVYIHAYVPGETARWRETSFAETAMAWLSLAISQGLARIAVPLLFLISGYLFFLNWNLDGKSFAQKLRSRTRSLLIPFLFWNLLTLLIYSLGQTIPVTWLCCTNRPA